MDNTSNPLFHQCLLQWVLVVVQCRNAAAILGTAEELRCGVPLHIQCVSKVLQMKLLQMAADPQKTNIETLKN